MNIEKLREKLSEALALQESKDKAILEINQKIDLGITNTQLDSEDLETLESGKSELMQEKEGLLAETIELQKDIDALEEQLIEAENAVIKRLNGEENTNQKKGGKTNMKSKVVTALQQYRRGLDAVEAVDGIKTDTEGLELIFTNDILPLDDRTDTPDLSKLFTVRKTNKGKVTERVREDASQVFNTVAELEENPELEKPKFTKNDLSVETYRGQLTISEEAVADADINLEQEVADEIAEVKVNTKNKAIVEILDTLTPEELTSVEDLRVATQTAVPRRFNPFLLMSQTAFADVSGAKYGDGRYIFNEDPTKEAEGVIFGRKVYVVDDEILGEVGNKKVYLAGAKAITLYDRVNAAVRWAENGIYGRILAGVIRFAVSNTYKNAAKAYTVNFQ